MSFYKYFLPIMTFVTLHFQRTLSTGNEELVIGRKGLETVSQCGVGFILYADVNNTSNEVDYEVEVSPDECCVDVGSDEECHFLEIIGDCVETVPRGTLKTFKLVAPLIDPFERNGYCIIYLDSKPKNRQRGMMRDTVRIPFNTHIKNSKQPMEIPNNVKPCNGIDEDPFNDCEPVDCEIHYNGKKSYFDQKTKRCVEVPTCVSGRGDEDIPKVIYELTRNKCVIGNSVTNSDLNLIKELSSRRNKKAKDILILKTFVKTPAKAHLPATILKVNNVTKETPKKNQSIYTLLKFDTAKFENVKRRGRKFLMAKYFIANRWTVLIFICIMLLQCCLIFTLVRYIGHRCEGASRKKSLIRNFFNYRQDASVTTPLICTSNIDTDTTEFQYLSESSNVDKKIKCYKACQKERNNNVKMSMSDDILSKCLNRRDWNSKIKSEAIPEVNLVEDRRDKVETVNESKYQPNLCTQAKKSSVKVNFMKEEPKVKNKEGKSSKGNEVKRENDQDDIQCELSEKEIKCHSYNAVEDSTELTGFKPSAHSKVIGFFQPDKSKTGTVSFSTEKGAQAEFSNDSIDDFLSERGLIFIPAEDLSKYSFSSQSNVGKSSSLSSGVSSKTSKNNVVKNVLSRLHIKRKHGPSSDPGAKKPSRTDIELIHMSRGSLYSSNNESDYLKSLKVTKDSRSSM